MAGPLSSLLFPLRLSLQVAFCATVVTILIGIPISYVLARKHFRGKEVLDLILTIPMVLPPVVTGYFLLLIIGRNGLLGNTLFALTGHRVGLLFTWYAEAIAAFAVSFPFMIKATRASMEMIDQELINASYMLGRSEFQTAIRVVLPLSRGGIMAGATLAFARAMGEFGATIMVAGNISGKTNTVPLSIYSSAQDGDWSGALWMVLALVVLSGSVMYISNWLGRRASIG